MSAHEANPQKEVRDTTDKELLALYQARNQNAVRETENRFGGYCYTIAYNILGSRQDAEECVNDTLLRLWDSIPPAEPDDFYAYIAALTRNLARNRYKHDHAAKRRGAEADLALDELVQMPAANDSVEETVDGRRLGAAINAFLETLSKKQRIIFVQRYWYGMAVEEIAEEQHMPKGTVTVSLMRTRKKLQSYLERGGLM